MSSKVLMIVNPIAGRKRKDKYYEVVKNNLAEHGYEVSIEFTTIEHNARYIVENCESDYDIVIACGGDGTLNEVTQGLYNMKKQIPVGFIPCGTTNDYAKSLNIPFNKKHLSKNIDNYSVRKIDLGLFNEKTFNYAAAFGIFSKTSYSVSRKMKNTFGRVAYLWSGFKEIFTYKTYRMKFEYDGKTIEDDFAYGTITNAHYVGGFHFFRKEKANLDDGLFEVVLIKKPRSILGTFTIIIKMISGNFKDKNIQYFRTSKLHIESLSENCGWSIDGEYGGDDKIIDIENIQQWSSYLIPNDAKKEDY